LKFDHAVAEVGGKSKFRPALFARKRLEKGRFSWPEKPDADGKVTLSSAQWAMLIGGIDLKSTRRKSWWRINEK